MPTYDLRSLPVRVRLMQLIDYYAGIPLCLGVSAWHAVTSVIAPRPPKEPKKIVFIELSEMGSAFLAYSSLMLATQRVGRENVYFLIFEKNRESVDLLGVIPKENVITISDKNFPAFATGALKALAKMRSIGIDTTLDLELFSRATSLLSYLSGAVNRVGFDNFTDEGLYRGSFITHRVMLNNHQHIALNFLALVQALTVDRTELPMLKENVTPLMMDLPHINPTPEEREDMWKRICAVNPKLTTDSKLVILNPDPGLLALRGWPVDRYAALAKKLLEKDPDLFIAVMGLPRSSSFSKAIFPPEYNDRCLDLCGKTKDLKEVTTLFHFARVLVTNDSGPGHLASLSKVPAVVLFGPESPEKYGPLGDFVTTLFANFSCSPCYSPANHRHSICTNNRCLQAISLDQVYNATAKHLS